MTIMLLVCPSCRTRYVVPDTAIGAGGRQVRCANCKHSWFQDGPEFDPAESLPTAAAPPRSATVERGASEPGPPPGYEAAGSRPQSSFDHAPPFRARRNPARYLTIAAALFALIVVGLGAAVWHFGLLSSGISFASSEPDLRIILDENQDRQTLRDGTEYFAASGAIVNSSPEEQVVPPLLVVLRDAGGRVVYQWKMVLPVKSLAPGGRIEFNEAKLDVPRAASQLEVGWAGQGG